MTPVCGSSCGTSTPRIQDAPLEDKLRLGRRAATNLISQNYALWRGHWPEEPTAPLTEAEKRDLAQDDAAWSDPETATILVWLRVDT
jgi:hypothetical protein